ncbi:hypothetical protein SUSAZ_01495 [Sulfolobus acidocaldarius SUSAZ]|nr:hypothetical protein SUSAZ_01495 [Sulfolobus acidocaldarius SUSAZ]
MVFLTYGLYNIFIIRNSLKELSKIRSKNSSLIFYYGQLIEKAKNETLRLSALIAQCEFYDKEKAILLRKYLEEYFDKYVRL